MGKLTSRSRLTVGAVAILLLVALATPASAKPGGVPARGISFGSAEFLGAVEFETGFEFAGTEVGGLSGLVYDGHEGLYYALADERGPDARYYSLTIDTSDGSLDDGDVSFVDVTFLTTADGNRFEPGSLDPEGFEIIKRGHLIIGSERDLNNAPWIKSFGLDGTETQTFPLPDYYLPSGDPQSFGVARNLAFESLTLTPNGRLLYAATENALVQDGPRATIDLASPSRVLEYRVNGNALNQIRPAREFVYVVDPIPFQNPGTFADNGLVEMQALDNFGTFLAMERSFAVGIGNTVRIFETSLSEATDVSGYEDIDDVAYVPMSKELVVDLGDFGVTLDNLEGMAFGPRMRDGRYPLYIVADNNFNPAQRTLLMAFAVDLERNVR